MKYPNGIPTDSPSTEPLRPARISPVQKRELVVRIANTPHLNRSVRLTELLTYLVERSIGEVAEGLREQEIGTNVFGRDPNYDTGQDNIVRVQVSQLRKKLESYFSQEGSKEPVVIEIPRGGYLPIFLERNVLPPSPTELDQAAPARGESALLTLLLLATTLFFIGLSIWLWNRPSPLSPTETRQQEREGIRTTAIAALWKVLLNKGQQTDLVLADSTLTILQDHGGNPLSLDEVLQRKFADALPPNLTEDERTRTLAIVDRRYTSLSDVELVGKVLQLRQPDQPVPILTIARDYQMRAFKTNNVILLGSKRSNPWVELLEPSMNFRFHYPDGQRDPIILNTNPRPGEEKTYLSTFQDARFSVVALLPTPSRTGAVLILQGDNAISTEAAGEFICSEEHLGSFFTQIGYPYQSPDRPAPPWFEVLLQTEQLQGATRSFRIVGYRTVKM
jgi:hypothetical protein